MRRRLFVGLFIGSCALTGAALAQGVAAPGVSLGPPQITPQNPLEQAFVDAMDSEALRPAFRRQLLQSRVVLALASSAPDAAPREIAPRDGVRAGMVFTSNARIDAVLGPAAPRAMMTGRAALERLRGRHVLVNARLAPMLVLEPEDVADYLAAPAAPPPLTGPTE